MDGESPGHHGASVVVGCVRVYVFVPLSTVVVSAVVVASLLLLLLLLSLRASSRLIIDLSLSHTPITQPLFADDRKKKKKEEEEVAVSFSRGGGIDFYLPSPSGLGRDSVRLWVHRPRQRVALLLHVDLTQPVKAFRRAVARAYKMERKEKEKEKKEEAAFWLDLEGKPLRDNVLMGDYAPTPDAHVCMHEELLRGGMEGVGGGSGDESTATAAPALPGESDCMCVCVCVCVCVWRVLSVRLCLSEDRFQPDHCFLSHARAHTHTLPHRPASCSCRPIRVRRVRRFLPRRCPPKPHEQLQAHIQFRAQAQGHGH
jgi:hypothetical protein